VLLFYAMEAGLPPGLVSVLIQLQGPLTLVLAALFLRERATAGQWAGLAVAMVGVVLIARSVEGSASLLAVGIALLSALSWAAGNLFLRETRAGSVLAVTAWASLVPALPLLLASLVHDGVTATFAPILAPTLRGWFVLFYTVVPVMWLGYLMWGTLLRSYPAGKVGPVSLLVPVCALLFSALLTGESIDGLRLVGVIVVLGVLAIYLPPRLFVPGHTLLGIDFNTIHDRRIHFVQEYFARTGIGNALPFLVVMAREARFYVRRAACITVTLLRFKFVSLRS